MKNEEHDLNTDFGLKNRKSVSKRPRNVLSIERKLQIIERLEKGESGSSLSRIFKVGKATISEIKNRKELIMSFASKCDSPDLIKKRKTMRKPKDEKLEEAIQMWLLQKRSMGDKVSGPLLCEKALEFTKSYNRSTDFKASSGWLKNFKLRHGIKEFEVEGKIIPKKENELESFKETFLGFLKQENYEIDDIYNADETSLHWKSIPHKTMVARWERMNSCQEKERVTILASSNASGTHKLPLLILGKDKNPQSLKEVLCLPVVYKWEREGWMNCELFYQWFSKYFIPEVRRFREMEGKRGKVLLILDKAPSHPEAQRLNSVHPDFEVIFLPPNLSPLLQPLEQGVLEKFKIFYKRKILKKLESIDDERLMNTIANQITIKDACCFAAESWESLPQEDLSRAWGPSLGGEERVDLGQEEEVKKVVSVVRGMPGYADCEEEEVKVWLAEDNDSGFRMMDDQEIINYVQQEKTFSTYGEEEEEEEEDHQPTSEEVIRATEMVISWYEKQKESNPSQFLALRNVLELATQKRFKEIKKEITL